MTAPALVQQILLVAAEALLLYCLSRILFVWALQALATSGHGGGPLVKLLRLPGNALHELSHAIGYLVCGYRVKRLVLCIVDPAGRGSCAPGRPWLPLAPPWLATGVAAMMPLFVGTAALYGLARLLGVPLGMGDSAADEPRLLALWDGVRITLQSLDYRDWRTYAFFYAAFSIGAELAPSDNDVRRSVGPLAVVAASVAVAGWYLGALHPDSRAWAWFSQALSGLLDAVAALLALGLLAVGLVAAVVLLPALAWRALRKLSADA